MDDARTHLQEILEAIHALEKASFQSGETALDDEPAAELRRLSTEAKVIIGSELGPLNDFSTQLVFATTQSSPPKRSDVLNVLKIVQGAVNHVSRVKGVAAVELDSTTGLLKKEAFDVALKVGVEAAKGSGEPLALIFADVDHFKRVNDEHGHSRGNEVLAEVARRLRVVCRGKGDVFRFGGEEMIVLLPNHDLAEALAVAERCRSFLNDTPCGGLPISASFGVSVLPRLALTEKQLLETADTAMYDAKDLGRNLVRYLGEAPPTKEKWALPERKAPSGGLTDAQRLQLRKDHFQGRRIYCPIDEGLLKTNTHHPIGQPIPSLIIQCPLCGLNETI